jgi:DNA replication ATP-dependent helicase Dna2
LVSLDTEGKVDRKLNVALTRAKQHLVIVGNEELMRKSAIYGELLEWAKVEKVRNISENQVVEN